MHPSHRPAIARVVNNHLAPSADGSFALRLLEVIALYSACDELSRLHFFPELALIECFSYLGFGYLFGAVRRYWYVA